MSCKTKYEQTFGATIKLNLKALKAFVHIEIYTQITRAGIFIIALHSSNQYRFQ